MDGSFDPDRGFDLGDSPEAGVNPDPIIGDQQIPGDPGIPKDFIEPVINTPDWGKVKPFQEFEYTDRNGNSLFWIGRFLHPGSATDESKPMYWNGTEWLRKMNPSFHDALPLLNLMDIYEPTPAGRVNTNEIIICPNERSAFALQTFFESSNLPFIATTWFGGAKKVDNVDWQPLAGRQVVVWMNNSKESLDLGKGVVARISHLVTSARMVRVDRNWEPDFGSYEFAQSEDFRTITSLIGDAEVVQLSQPVIEKNRLGMSNLEGDLPVNFIRSTIHAVGRINRAGKPEVVSDYITAMKIVELDPAFKDVCRYDVDTSSLIWDLDLYPTVDDLKNAILRRLAKYGCQASKQVRDDIVASLSSDPARRVNSVKDFFEELIQQYPDAGPESLTEFMSHIDIGIPPEAGDDGFGPNLKMYTKVMNQFFTKAALRIYTAGMKNPVPNDCCPVLVGTQGVGKSRLCQYLAMDKGRFFVDIGNKGASMGDPNLVRMILGKIVGELGEMSVYKKADVETVKSWISETVDVIVPKFKEGARSFPRLTSVLGTSNETDFLKDLSGNRRFFPIIIQRVSEDLLGNPEIIRKVWSYYYQLAKSAMNPEYNPDCIVPAGLVVVPADVEAYYKVVRENSIDLGLIGDIVKDAIQVVEARAYNELDSNPLVRYVNITILEVAKEVYDDDPTKATFDFKKKVKFYLNSMGYHQNVFKKFDTSVRGFSLHKLNPDLLDRVGEHHLASIQRAAQKPGSGGIFEDKPKVMKEPEIRDDIF